MFAGKKLENMSAAIATEELAQRWIGSQAQYRLHQLGGIFWFDEDSGIGSLHDFSSVTIYAQNYRATT